MKQNLAAKSIFGKKNLSGKRFLVKRFCLWGLFLISKLAWNFFFFFLCGKSGHKLYTKHPTHAQTAHSTAQCTLLLTLHNGPWNGQLQIVNVGSCLLSFSHLVLLSSPPALSSCPKFCFRRQQIKVISLLDTNVLVWHFLDTCPAPALWTHKGI